jgi:hypothetical protein
MDRLQRESGQEIQPQIAQMNTDFTLRGFRRRRQ